MRPSWTQADDDARLQRLSRLWSNARYRIRKDRQPDPALRSLCTLPPYLQVSSVVTSLQYGLMNAFGHLGPGNMIIVLSSESYATPVRGTCFGLSAALGKLGAVLGTQAFLVRPTLASTLVS